MAIILKSDVVGQGLPLSRKGGYRGPRDWSGFSDFHSGSFHAPDHFAADDFCITTLAGGSTHGVVMEQPRQNFFSGWNSNTLETSSRNRFIAMCAIGGAVVATPRTGVDSLVGTGTLTDPFIFSHDRKPVTVMTTGSPIFRYAEELAGGSSPSIILSSSGDTRRLLQFDVPRLHGRDSGTIVVHLLENPLGAPLADEKRTYLSLQFGESLLTCTRQRTKNWLDVGFSRGRMLHFQHPVLNSTLAVSWSRNRICFAINNVLKPLSGVPDAVLTRIGIGNGLSGLSAPLGGIVPAVVWYDRCLDDDELRKASASWR
jgi:hypothetical protein